MERNARRGPARWGGAIIFPMTDTEKKIAEAATLVLASSSPSQLTADVAETLRMDALEVHATLQDLTARNILQLSATPPADPAAVDDPLPGAPKTWYTKGSDWPEEK